MTVELAVILFTALLVGMSKTGIQGVTLFAVPILALTFGAKESTGIILPMLCFSDIIAVIYYRRSAEWKYIIRLVPPAIVGFFVALLVDYYVAPEGFKQLMGFCLLIGVVLMLWAEFKNISNKITESKLFGMSFGLLGGFTTMIGNAAGPVMSIYLLSMKMPKLSFVGTSAWFFLVVNYLKLPLQYFVWNNISLDTLKFTFYGIPFMIIGAVIGIVFVKRIPEKGFRYFILGVTIVSSILLIF